MRIIILIILFAPCLFTKAQTSGNVLMNADGSIRVSDGSIPIAKIVGLVSAMNGKAPLASPAFTGSFGYATGMGGTTTQLTNKSTGVTLNKICGQITMVSSALAAGAEVSFSVTNNTVVSTDVIIVNIQSVGTAGSYLVGVGSVSNGSFTITVSNVSTGSLSQAIVLNFIVIKSVNQ